MESSPQDDETLQQDQVAIAGYFRTAFAEVSTTLGGKELVAEVESLPTDPDSSWPVNALQFLEQRYPGAAESVFALAEALQAAAHGDGAAE